MYAIFFIYQNIFYIYNTTEINQKQRKKDVLDIFGDNLLKLRSSNKKILQKYNYTKLLPIIYVCFSLYNIIWILDILVLFIIDFVKYIISWYAFWSIFKCYVSVSDK